MKHVVPYANTNEGKKEQVTQMFDNIAGRYDALNTFFTMGIDRNWRKKVIRELEEHKPQHILDLATGTGELALQLLDLNPKEIVGIDLSKEMLLEGEKKIKEKGVEHIIQLKEGDGESLPADDNYFDAATIGFGIRNFENPKKGMQEVLRVLKPGGIFTILELSTPDRFPVKQFHKFYSNRVMPFCARVVSTDKQAYKYLPESISKFVSGNDMLNLLSEAGYVHTRLKRLTFGVASIYTGIKPK